VVTAARRRGGLGRGLLEAVEGWARARSLDVLRLRVNKKRRGARAFYERLGFQRTKEQLQYTKLLSATVARRSRRASARGRASSRV
jgi:GNAT superfamily N-acetyltransferase